MVLAGVESNKENLVIGTRRMGPSLNPSEMFDDSLSFFRYL